VTHELRRHPGWWARLEGDEFDLKALASTLDDRSPAQIHQFDGRYYLRIAEFDQFRESGDVETRVSEILRVLNGAARVQYGNNREVRVDAAARVQRDGQIQHFIHAKRNDPRTRTPLGHADGQRRVSPGGPRTTIAERALEAALNDPQAERALRIFGRDDADYRDLYHVLEIADAASGDNIYSEGTVTKADVRRFKHTANSVHALGDQARHGHEPTKPPSQPMPFPEAQALVGRVLRA
jgi:hypothetical protein